MKTNNRYIYLIVEDTIKENHLTSSDVITVFSSLDKAIEHIKVINKICSGKLVENKNGCREYTGTFYKYENLEYIRRIRKLIIQ